MMNIVRPTLLLDKDKCLRNIERMANKAESLNLQFRPHFKTHQSALIGEWFRGFGVKSITVSSVMMAGYFADHGWDDITIAFPINILEIDDINSLAGKIRLNLLIENKEALSFLVKFIKYPVGIFIKIDTGYNRTGISSGKTSVIDLLLEKIKESPLLSFQGFLSHTGHTYQADSPNDIFSRHFDALLKLRGLKIRYRRDYPGLKISLGDTPSCSICENFDEVDEIRPGNFVFYDLMQHKLGVCTLDDIAVRLACPVVATHGSRNEVVIYGGAVHFSKETIQNIDGKNLYGRIIIKSGSQEIMLDEKNYIRALSQEHGIIQTTPKDLKCFKVGDVVEILPVHSCLTADLMGQYMTTQGELISRMGKDFLS